MWTFIEISVFILSSVQLVYGSTHAVIGNYSQLNPKDCGYSKKSETVINCFEWHKNSNSSMKSGRNATLQDIPWIVHIEAWEYYGNGTVKAHIGQCSGSLISTQWILTAAHCLFENGFYSIYAISFGPNFITDQNNFQNLTIVAYNAYPHPDYYENYYENSTIDPDLFDIGLIRLNDSIDSMDNPLFKQFGSICLPERDIINQNIEYAMTAGWGQLEPMDQPAQMGYRRILAFDENLYMSLSIIYSNKLDKQATICGGDSGGPLWQYYMGRAVLIGINYKISDERDNCEAYDVIDWPGYHQVNMSIVRSTRVSKHINWIINVTQLH